MSLLSSFDDFSLLQPEKEETDTNKDTENTPKLPRTNSLDDLGIKVLQFDCAFYFFIYVFIFCTCLRTT